MIVLRNADNSLIDVILGDNSWIVQQVGRKLQFTSRLTNVKRHIDVTDDWRGDWGWNVRPDGIGATLWNNRIHRPNTHAKHSEYLARLTAAEYAEEQAARYYD